MTVFLPAARFTASPQAVSMASALSTAVSTSSWTNSPARTRRPSSRMEECPALLVSGDR